jgi:hypothetical protein
MVIKEKTRYVKMFTRSNLHKSSKGGPLQIFIGEVLKTVASAQKTGPAGPIGQSGENGVLSQQIERLARLETKQGARFEHHSDANP